MPDKVLNNSARIIRGSKTNLKIWISITKIGGSANVVKNAVAPAIRKGSFFKSSWRVCLRSFDKEKTNHFFLLAIHISIKNLNTCIENTQLMVRRTAHLCFASYCLFIGHILELVALKQTHKAE